MRSNFRHRLAFGVIVAASLAACGGSEPPIAAEPVPPAPSGETAAETAPPAVAVQPVSPAAPATAPPPAAADAWVGTWRGPEGTSLRIDGGGGAYDVAIKNLDGERTFTGTAQRDTIAFERDGVAETIRAGNGVDTGMKWLAEKRDCLVVKAGEGYCRD